MNIQDYVKHFNNTFNTKIPENLDINKFPMLKMAFEYLGEYFYKENQDQNKANKLMTSLEKELFDTMTDKQQELFENYLDSESISRSKLVRQMLVFGYSLAYQELKEMNALK